MSDTRFSVRPLQVGAEIIGLSPGSEDDRDVQEGLYAAWLQYGILLFRDVRSADRHLSLSRCFGQLELHPLVQMRAEEDPLFMKVGGETSLPYLYDETELKVGTIPWHRDTAYTPNIAKGAMLRLVEVPATGGETLFADTAMAYDDLPSDVKARLDGLEYCAKLRRTPMEQTGPGAIWKTVRPPTDSELAPAERVERAGGGTSVFPPVAHPALIVHPESSRLCIFLSPKEFEFFLGMGRSDSDKLFAYLVSHMLQDKYVYKHSWSVNDSIVWDNRRFMHAASGNHLGEKRRGLRTTLAGGLCVGRPLSGDVA